MNNNKIFRDLFLIAIFSIFSQIISGCQTGKQSLVSDYRLQIGDLESIIQSGNWLKFFSDFRAESYTGNLNPGIMISSGRDYHILKLEDKKMEAKK